MDTSKLDEQLANGPDFLNRLCLVRMSPQSDDDAASAAAPPLGEEVAFYNLWPALKFDSHRELVDQMKLVQGLSNANKLKFKLLLEYNRLLRHIPLTQPLRLRHGVAYLIGRGGSIVLVPKTSSGLLEVEIDDVHVFDFCRHVEEMFRGEGHTGTEEFQAAFQLAMHRMEVSMEEESPLEIGVGMGMGTEEEGKEATTAMVVSAKKAYSNAECPPRKNEQERRGGDAVGKPLRGKSQRSRSLSTDSNRKITYSNLEYSPFRETKEKKKKKKKAKKLLLPSAPRKREDEPLTGAEEDTLPVRTVEIKAHTSGGSELSLSCAPSHSEDESQAGCSAEEDDGPSSEVAGGASNVRRSNRSSPASSVLDLPWGYMWNDMKAQGWSHMTGSGLVQWYYVHPSCAGMKKTELIKEKVEGIDYFEKEEDVMHYARVNLGWRPNCRDASTLSPKDAQLADRVKKRKRGALKPNAEKQKAEKQKMKKADTMKTGSRKADTKQALKKEFLKKSNKPKPLPTSKAKKQADVSIVKERVEFKPAPCSKCPSSPEAWESEGSRFSEGSHSTSSHPSSRVSVCKRTRSKCESPPVGVSEAMLDDKITGLGKKKDKSSISKKLHFPRSPDSASDGASSPSEQSSLDTTYQIMASRAAWLLLSDRYGFKFHTNKYCLPGKENWPGKESLAVEGMNFFATVEDLRKHLCAYGLPEIKPTKGLSEVEGVDLERWVRYAHVINIRDAEIINENEIGESLTPKQAWVMLQKLGLRYSSGSYIYPNSDSSIASKFDRQEDFFKHLARFGIPRVDGIQPKAVSEEDRLLLDLYIAATPVETFKRILPPSGEINEITPKRTMRNRSGPVATTDQRTFVMQKQTSNHKAYRMEFENLKILRTFPTRLISSQEAFSTLVSSYNFRLVEREGQEYYCLPDVTLAEGEDSILCRDYFKTVQDMRENLCALGLPPIAKGAKAGDVVIEELESWVRCAHITALRDDAEGRPPDMPCFVRPKPKQARDWLKTLGYTFRDNFHMVLLPGAVCHGSEPGVDRFDNLRDLFDHVARFGLKANSVVSDLSLTTENRLMLEGFAAGVATFDVSKRINWNATIDNRSLVAKQDTAVTELVTDGVVRNAATKFDVTSTPNPPAMVVDEADQDTPQQSPLKKPTTNHITNFFTTKGNATKKTADADYRGAGLSSPVSSLSILSVSCLDKKGDEYAEACFNDPHEQDVPKTPSRIDSKGHDEVDGPFISHLEQESSNAPESISQNMGTDDASPRNLEADSAGQDITLENLPLEHLPQAESPNMAWTDLWLQMRKAGWKYRQSGDSVTYYRICASVATMKYADMLSQCTEGIHYFRTTDIKQYAMDHLSWLGEETKIESPPSPMTGISLTSMGKKRKLTTTAASELDDAPSSPKRCRGSWSERDNVRCSTPTPASPEKKPTPSEEAKPSSPTKNHGVETSDVICVNPQSNCGEEYQALPDKEHTVRETLECCQMVLHPTFKKHQLSKSSCTSVVSSNEDDIKDFMTKSIESATSMDGITVPSPGFMYICGGPGTGKTTAVASCRLEMTKWAKRCGYNRPRLCAINMAGSQSSNTKGGIMRDMLKKIAAVLKINGESPLQTFEEEFKKDGLVLILDEIDMLFKQHGGIGGLWFKTLVKWAEDKELPFSMIGISNCVNDDNATRVRELAHSPRELIFSAYNQEDILAILEQRLGKKVVDRKALQLISRRVAASSGDARRALEITSNAVAKCADLMSPEKLGAVVEDGDNNCMLPLVKLPHMMRAIREGMPMKHGDIICGLPQAAKVILCIAVSLSQVWGPTAEISISQLKKYCVEASHHAIMDDLGVGHVNTLVQMLVDAGLLVTGNSGHFNSHDVNAKLKIGVQMDDVEIALEQSLLKSGGFYQSLVDYVKRSCPGPDTGNI